MKAACFSVAAMDFFPQQGQHFAGGNSLNQAVRFRQIGYHSAFVGALGRDDAGDRIAALLQSESVDISHMVRVNGHTACNQLINDEMGERYGMDGAWQGGVYEAFQLEGADWAYISGFDVWSTHANDPNYLQALERKSGGQLMGVDFLHLQDYDLLQKSLRVVDIAYFGGTADMADDLARIARENKGVIVLTLGAAGSMAFQGDQVVIQQALPMDRVVDTTGCGDAFQAAFTASYFHSQNIEEALLAGAELGRQAAAHYGGIRWAEG